MTSCPSFLLPVPASCPWFRVLRHARGHVYPARHFSSAENAPTGRVSTLAADVHRSSAGSQSHVVPTLFAGLATVLVCRPIFVALWFSDQHLVASGWTTARTCLRVQSQHRAPSHDKHLMQECRR